MNNNSNKTVFFLAAALAVAVVACSGSEFSGSSAPDPGESGAPAAGEGQTGPLAGSPSASGSTGGPSEAGSPEVGGSNAGAGTESGGKGNQSGSGSVDAGAAGIGVSAGAGGTVGGSGSSSGGSAAGTFGSGGSSGSTSTIDYHCAVHAPGQQPDPMICLAQLCTDLKYECGQIPDGCAGEATPCGAGVLLDCAKFLPLKTCSPYTQCNASHQCGDECKRVKTGPVCSVNGSSFRYVCASDQVPGCYDTDPGKPDNQHICECSVHQDVDGFCCSENQNACMVKFAGNLDSALPGCAGRQYEYTCVSGKNPDPASCGIGQNGFCCATPGIE